MTNEDAILDVLVPCNSEGEQLTYPKCLDNLNCLLRLLRAQNYHFNYLLIFLDGAWTSLTDYDKCGN